MANSVRKNTVKLEFAPGVKTPSYLDVLKFTMDELKLSVAEIHSIYKDENGGQFYVKLMDEETFTAFIADSEEEYNFKFDDGSSAKVTVLRASRVFHYVRIFNLPPEIEDSAIQYVLGQYGTIRQHVRERFPSELKVDIYNGVRGVHMEVSKEIPAHLYIGHFRARIFYEGLKNKCFFCKAEGHVKKNCPKMAAVSAGSGSSTQPLGASSLGRPAKPVIESNKQMTLKMTTLTPKPTNTTTTLTSTQHQATNTQEPSASITMLTKTTSETPSIPTTVTTTTVNSSIDTTKDVQITNIIKEAIDGLDPDKDDQRMEDEISEIDRQKTMKRTMSSSPDCSGAEGVAEQVKEKERAVRAAKNSKKVGFTKPKRGRKKR